MMYRPVVDERVLDFMRHGQKPLEGATRAIQKEAQADNVPIIPEETVAFLRFFLGQCQVKDVLEVGTAYGFSASLFSKLLPENGHVTTIDRFDLMIEHAKANFERYGLNERITLLEGQAADILPELPSQSYDLIFMDSAKSKYITFLPECLRLVRTKGMILIDDIFQGGTVFDDDDTIKRGARRIHLNLKKLLYTVNHTEGLTSCVLPLGDGLLMITKEQEKIELNID